MKKVFLLFFVPLCLGLMGTELESCKAPVPQTGQTTCWDPADTTAPVDTIDCANAAAQGEDGSILAGVPWPSPRFIDLGDGTIKDKLTGLIWLKDANCFGQRTWAQALTDSNTLKDPDCGLSDGSVEGDWYLPNVRELASLIDYEKSFGPVLPSPNPFMDFQSDVYWSSSTSAGTPTSAWVVRFSSGLVQVGTKTGNFFVLPVRDGL